MSMRVASLCLILLMFCGVAHAQQQNNVWTFGFGVGVSFNSNPPVGITSSMNSVEAVASVCDRKTGALLFYTDGTTVYDRQHNPMVGGNGSLFGSPSSTTSSIAVPRPGSQFQYYII